MAAYAKRIIDSYTAGQYIGPATCNSTSSCNLIVNTFPQNGRPTLVWSSGLGTNNFTSGANSNTWWNAHGFAYEGAFSGSGNARVLVSLLGQDTHYPDYTHTYKIVGYATDTTGKVGATSEIFTTWNGYVADPGDGTCAGGCNYGQCCSSGNLCVSDQAGCEGGSATVVPPGWYCSDYFVTGLGYDPVVCTNTMARIADVLRYIEITYVLPAVTTFKNTGTFPYTTQTTIGGNPYPGLISIQMYSATGTSIWFLANLDFSYLGLTSNDQQVIFFLGSIDGEIDRYCGEWNDATGNSYVDPQYLPPNCRNANISTIEPNYL